MIVKTCLAALAVTVLAGCSGIRFSNYDDGKSHPYRVATPALKVVTDPDCKMTAEVISIPGRLNWLKFQTGLGKINDKVEFEPGGTIKSINVQQEGVADDLNKLLGTLVGAVRPGGSFGATGIERTMSDVEQTGCTPSVALFPIDLDAGGEPIVDMSKAVLKVTADRAQ